MTTFLTQYGWLIPVAGGVVMLWTSVWFWRSGQVPPQEPRVHEEPRDARRINSGNKDSRIETGNITVRE